CGPARLGKLLTGWRGEHDWLAAGASVPQQQITRDFARSRAKALKDIKARLPMRQRTGMPRFKKKDLAAPTLNYTRRGFRLMTSWRWRTSNRNSRQVDHGAQGGRCGDLRHQGGADQHGA
ncbi:hypothetical protein ACIBOT_42505, partial [Nonomuraea wenchangensis]